MTGETDIVGRKQRRPGAGHRGKGGGYRPPQGAGNGNPGKPLDTAPEKQRARALKRWAAHRERVAMGPHVVEEHARKVRFEKMRLEIVREKRAMRASLPPRVCSLEGE